MAKLPNGSRQDGGSGKTIAGFAVRCPKARPFDSGSGRHGAARNGDGFVYAANTQGYVDEALASLASFRRFLPTAPVTILAPRALFVSGLPHVEWLELAGTYDSPIIKAEAIRAPYERTIFLDTDTRIIGDISGLFDILDGFDMALVHEPTRGWDYETPAARAFCELNTGVIAFRNTPEIKAFFGEWTSAYLRLRQAQGLKNDQPAFRETLWNSRTVRHATLPSEYHFITGKGNSIAWDALLLHGRQDLARLEGLINRDLGPRSYEPAWGMLTSPSGRKQRLLVFLAIVRSFVSGLRTASAAPARETPVTWWK